MGVLTGKLSREDFGAHSHDYILTGVVEVPESAETQLPA
ncbi:hypothetical protein ART_2716 [Arthrobacter sp. PAMC 25486]|nr:hypothetical protein ART_2716 [Arthrobacter sp. PAMC 25486]